MGESVPEALRSFKTEALPPPPPISQCYLGWFGLVDPGLADPHWGGFRWEQTLSFSNPPDLMSFRVGPPPLGEVRVVFFMY